jgi:hypothetical protein
MAASSWHLGTIPSHLRERARERARERVGQTTRGR